MRVETFISAINQQFGEIEAHRIERLFETSNDFSEFSFEAGYEGVQGLYKSNLDEVIDQCLNRVAPNVTTVTLKSVKFGLGVNKSTHTDPDRRHANEALFEDLVTLGNINSTIEKQAFKDWVHNCLTHRS